TADDQHLFGAIADGSLGSGIGDLLAHVGGTALRVCVDTDESTYFRFDNHVASCDREYAKAAIIMVRRAENSSDSVEPAPQAVPILSPGLDICASGRHSTASKIRRRP